MEARRDPFALNLNRVSVRNPKDAFKGAEGAPVRKRNSSPASALARLSSSHPSGFASASCRRAWQTSSRSSAPFCREGVLVRDEMSAPRVRRRGEGSNREVETRTSCFSSFSSSSSSSSSVPRPGQRGTNYVTTVGKLYFNVQYTHLASSKT